MVTASGQHAQQPMVTTAFHGTEAARQSPVLHPVRRLLRRRRHRLGDPAPQLPASGTDAGHQESRPRPAAPASSGCAGQLAQPRTEVRGRPARDERVAWRHPTPSRVSTTSPSRSSMSQAETRSQVSLAPRSFGPAEVDAVGGQHDLEDFGRRASLAA